jgi:hypothetical protein
VTAHSNWPERTVKSEPTIQCLWWWEFQNFELSIDQLIVPQSTEAGESIAMGLLIRRARLTGIGESFENKAIS